jgi:lipoate---protein ligase
MININSHSITPPVTGRLIPYLTATGAVQMQIDRWLLQEYVAGRLPPTLRFYQWSPIAISLGYHQRRYPAAWHDLTWQGQAIDLVRRPTGGRAVLHQGDLTYSIITSAPGQRLATYQQLCKFLIEGWRRLGLDLSYGDQGRAYWEQPDCFATATGADLVLDNGYKLIGSAQLIRDGAVLQHGSMRLWPDAELFATVFGKTAPLVPPQVKRYEVEAIENALIQAATDCWGISWQLAPLTPAEMAKILKLASSADPKDQYL